MFRFAQHDSTLYEISPKLATQQAAYHHGSSLLIRPILYILSNISCNSKVLIT